MTGSRRAFREAPPYPAREIRACREPEGLSSEPTAFLEPEQPAPGLLRAGLDLGLPASRALPTRVLALFLVLALLAPISAPAASEQEPPSRIALVIGNSNYETIPMLPNPRRDASAIADSLERLGFEVRRVLDGDQKDFEKALLAFAADRRSADIALFYFAGHGIQINGENYLLPVSIKAPKVEAILEQSLGLNDVRAEMQRTDPGLTIIILDSCRDNPFGPMLTQRTGETVTPISIGQGLAKVSGAAGMLIAYATQPGEVAYDGFGEHSPFTESLLAYLEKPGLEIRLMLGRVREQVVEETQGGQVPWVEEAVLGEFYFSEQPDIRTAAINAADGYDLAFWRSISRSDDARDYEAYLTKFPEGAFALLADNRLKALKVAGNLAEAAPAKIEPAPLSDEIWRQVKNSLFWLGYYNGNLGSAQEPRASFAVKAFQSAVGTVPSGKLTKAQVKQLHYAAANSLISTGERLADQIVFERARLRGIERGISEIALPAYRELVQRVADKEDGTQILAEAKAQVDAMHGKLEALRRQSEQAEQQYFTLVAAAGSGYAEFMRAARRSHVRAGGTEGSDLEASESRRQVFLRHALEYANGGRIDEDRWIKELR